MLREHPENRRAFLRTIGATIVLPLLPINILASETEEKKDAIAKAAKFVKPNVKWKSKELIDFLEQLPAEEMLLLKKAMEILGERATVNDLKGRYKDAVDVEKEAIWVGSNILYYPFRSSDLNYHDMVKWTAGKLSISKHLIDSQSTFMLEREITKSFFVKLWDKLTVEQRSELLDKIDPDSEIKDKAAIAALSGAATIGVLSASVAFTGFAFYTTMSVAISTIAGFFGVTLPFVAYSGASSLVAFLSGPLGWAIIGVAAVGGIALAGRANKKKTAGFILQLHMLKVAALLADGVDEKEIFPMDK